MNRSFAFTVIRSGAASIVAASLIVALYLHPVPASAEMEAVVETVPKWNAGDTWKYHSEKSLDRTVTQGAGVVQVTMTLKKAENNTSYTVTGTGKMEDEDCYIVRVSGDQKITGTYNTAPIEGESIAGNLAQTSTFEGIEYRRVSDLAFVRAEIRSKGMIEIAGELGASPMPFDTTSITIASPPVKQFQFPLVKGDTWHVASVLTTTTSGAAPDSVVTTFNYDCKVLEPRKVTLDNGKTFECVAVSQAGAQTTQSHNSGINIESVNGILFYAPSVRNRVKDEAEGEILAEYATAEIPKE
ncbi:hypothetical protein HZA56_02755 [Candidatus Poribacteria bacterium]|nr:hypothetical protein [Candidatus Poribacteria bacterium]